MQRATNDWDERSTRITRAISNLTGWLGSFPAILGSVAIVVAWVVGGFFVRSHFDNPTYQLLINTGTTTVTFIMVFIIQSTQNGPWPGWSSWEPSGSSCRRRWRAGWPRSPTTQRST